MTIINFLYGFPRVEEVACFLKPPSYISCEWALNFHNVSLQAPQVCSVVTLSTSVGKKRSAEYQGITIEFSKILPRRFSGFSFVDGVYMALAEKAILDTLYFHGRIPAEDELEMDAVDLKKLLEMSEHYPLPIRKHIQNVWGS